MPDSNITLAPSLQLTAILTTMGYCFCVSSDPCFGWELTLCLRLSAPKPSLVYEHS